MTDSRGAIKIDQDVFQEIVEEQSRLRRLQNGKKPSYSEILRRMWAAYQQQSPETPVTLHTIPAPENSEFAPANDYEQKMVAAVILFLRQEHDSPQLIGLLETLLKDQLAQVGANNGNNSTKRRA